MTRRHPNPDAIPAYRTKPLTAHVDDSYKLSGKLPEPTVCPQCGAVFHKGRWQWLPKPEAAHNEMCPACHRIHDEFPAGYITLSGDFLAQHRDELLNAARHIESKEKMEHPLQRIMAITDESENVVITTTDIHLARGIGDAIHNAYGGHLDLQYGADENLLRVYWHR